VNISLCGFYIGFGIIKRQSKLLNINRKHGHNTGATTLAIAGKNKGVKSLKI
jgi:hypothetical protein